MNWSKMHIVLKHEFRQKLRSKAFIILTIIGPVLAVALFVIPALLASVNTTDRQSIAIIDATGKIGDYFIHPDSAAIASMNGRFSFQLLAPGSVSIDSLRSRVERGSLTGLLTIDSSALVKEQGGGATLRVKNTNDFSSTNALNSVYQSAVRRERLKAQGFDPALMTRIENIPELETLKVSPGSNDSKDNGGTFAAGYLTGFIIYMSTILYGTMIMRSVVEEKSSRIIEVIVSSIAPYELLLGKVIGNACAAFLQVSIWAIILVLLSTVGIASAQAYLGESFHLGVSPFLFIYFILYFIFGFMIFATLYAMVGATVDQDSDMQQASMPITLLVVIPILTLMSVIQAPASTTSVILSLIPFFSPVLMMGRIFSETPPFWQIALSFVLMTVTFFAILWAAARIYRVGILMYGKRFSLKEAVKWLRYS